MREIEKLNIKLIISISQCDSVNLKRTRWNEMKILKNRDFDYNHHIISIMYTNARFQSIRTTSGFWTIFAQDYVNDKTFGKINIKIVISIL